MANPLPDGLTHADLTAYLEAVAQWQRMLHLTPFQEGHERAVAMVPLDTVYVPLRVGGAAPETRALEEAGQPTAASPDLLSNQLLNPEFRLKDYLVLLGDAGSGKTTILRHLIVTLADAWLAQDMALARRQAGLDPAAAGWLWPLFVPLRTFHLHCSERKQPLTAATFLTFLPGYVKDRYHLTLPQSFFKALLDSGRCLLALDGFDEVPDDLSRQQVVDLVEALAGTTAANHIILSSRVAAYGGATHLGGAFQTLWVQDLNPEEREAQVRRWVTAVSPTAAKPLDPADILDKMPPGSPLDELAITPMIVTTLCIVYFYDHELPEQRALLYRRCIDIMLDEGLRRDKAGRELAKRGGPLPVKRKRLARLAFELHRSGKDDVDRWQASRWLEPEFRTPNPERRAAQIATFLDAVADRESLLQERRGRFGFGRQHLTFREYLAGQHLILALSAEERTGLLPELVGDDRWREPMRLAAGGSVVEATPLCEAFLRELLALADAAADAPIRLAGYKLAAEALWDAGSTARDEFIDPDLQDEIREGLAERLLTSTIAAPAAGLLAERVAAAEALGHLGDPRDGVATLPPVLTGVLEGTFWFGDGQDRRQRTTEPFQAAIYPITNAQYALFMQAGGYDEQRWWSRQGWNWRTGKPFYDWQKMDQPDRWENPELNQPNQPVVGVTWFEAEAFCNWLSDLEGRTYRLPTEEEWERIARGTDGRAYPWGERWLDGLCNTKEAGIGRPCAVGLFPGGQSPTGAMDCSGNVWEWFSRPGFLKGGSWRVSRSRAGCGARGSRYPHHSDDDYGCRVVAPIS